MTVTNKNTVYAKAILTDRFWILERDGNKIGTISRSDNDYLLSSEGKTIKVKDLKELTSEFKLIFTASPVKDPEPDDETEFEIYGFPTVSKPYNSMYSVKNKLPIFTKRDNSDIQYCAGYFIIKFDNSWTKSFCPKLSTLESYEYQGPFHSKLEMNERLRLNRASK